MAWMTPRILWQNFKGLVRPRQSLNGPVTGISGTSPFQADVTVALQSSAVWACCRLISQSIAALPAQLYEYAPAGRTKATEHPLYRLLTQQPNPLQTLTQFLQSTVLHILLYGNAYVVPEYLEGEVVSLWLVMPDRVRIIVKPDGSYYYSISRTVGPPLIMQPNELIHFRCFSIDGICGLSPIQFAQMSLEIDAMSRRYAANIYANGGRPTGVLTYPGQLQQPQVTNIRNNWKLVYGGPQNAGNVVVLDNGAKYDALAIPPDQMEYIAQQKFSVEQISRLYGVPPHLIGAQDKPTYASVEQQAVEFLQYTILPIVVALEKTIVSSLLSGTFFYKLNIASFERSDIKTRYAAYATGRQWGWLSVNDIRDLEDLNRIGPEGDIYLQPLNMIPAPYAQQFAQGVTE